MDEKKFLILIKVKEKWVDKTSQTTAVVPQGKIARVAFTNGKAYPYKRENVKFLDKPEPIDISSSIITATDSSLGQNFSEVIMFEDYVCLFNGSRKVLKKHRDIQIKQNVACQENSRELIKYYSSIADLVKGTEGENGKEGLAHLSYYYQNKLGQISPESVLNHFINGSEPNSEVVTEPIIFPFGMNASQRLAVNRALKNQISLIQGPPGTGKTQTVLNIISNLLMQDKTVAVVAGNNSAVGNVYEKLEKEQLGFIAAKLGKSAVAKEFLEQKHPVPDLSLWALSKQKRADLRKKLSYIDANIDALLEAKNNLAKEKDYLSHLELEKRYFKEHFDFSPFEICNYSFSSNWATSKLLRFIAEFQHYSERGELGFFTKFRWLLRYGIYKFDTPSILSEEVFKRLISEYYLKRTVESKEQIKSLEQRLHRANFDELLAQKTEYSTAIFKGHIARNFSDIEQKKFDKYSYKGAGFMDFIKRYPVVMSTTDSIINNKPSLELFDYVIVDEASQVNLLTGFLTLACAKNIVVVGDLKQLPHIPNGEEKLDELAQEFNISPCYNYEHESLLSSLDKIFNDIPKTLLREHYRCHPQIIDYCNQKFYDGQLITMTEGKGEPFKIIKTVQGNHAAKPRSGKGYHNQRELDVIEKEILPEEGQHASMDNIGIITPYRSQANTAQDKWRGSGIEADTVHKFQGREKDTIIFSATANKIEPFMDQPNMLNVTVSRAKKRFVMVVSPNVEKQQGTNIGDLIRHIEYQSPSSRIVESKVVSIFDCLYSEFSDALNEFRAKVKRDSRYLSEDLMSTLLDDALSDHKYTSFAYKKDYPLKLLVNDTSSLTQDEKTFTGRSSHIDFLIYNKLDKLPILAIEVDGYSTHVLNEKQSARDEIKNSILKKIELPMQRFSTKESDEKARLDKILSNLIGV